jgi:hypothetical protein
LFSCIRNEGVKLHLTNIDTAPIDSLQVIVTGNTYNLEPIKPSESITIYINPTGESDIKLLTSEGKELLIEVYLEQNYTGTVKAEIKSDTVVSVIRDFW